MERIKIPLVDLYRGHQQLQPELLAAFQRVLASSSFILGQEVESFEQEFAAFCQTKYSIGVASGTDALFLALQALGISQGDEVILPANTFIATALAVSRCGATPILIDCDPLDYTIDVQKIEPAISNKTKAIIPVHLYGHPAEMNTILAIAKKHRLLVVEDACQAHGALYQGEKVGSFGDGGCFSFYPAKNLGALGDGGAVTTNNQQLYEKIRLLREYGQSKKYHHEIMGYNSRLDALQAALLKVKLKHLEENNQRRRKHAAVYTALLKDLPEIELPQQREGSEQVYHLYVIRTKRRDELRDYLQTRGIQTGIHYPLPIHLQQAYQDLGYPEGSFPCTERNSKEILSLPLFPELTEEEIKAVGEEIKNFLRR